MTKEIAIVLLSFCLSIVLLSFLLSNVLAQVRTTPIISVSCYSYFFWGWIHVCDPYETTEDIPGLQVRNCPDEIVMYVHGYWESPGSAIDKFNIVKRSLQFNNYTNPVVGFSWTSMTFSWFTWESWNRAKIYAELSGDRLAQLVSNFNTACEDTQIRFIAHSLGTRVILSALEYIHDNYPALRITSVHVLGAAVDDGEISTRSSFGAAIQNQTNEFHNKFSPEDDILEDIYFDSDRALGENGADMNIRQWWPSTYQEEDVSDELVRDPDHNGRNDWPNCGDNHNGYIGVLLDDGAMDELVSDWTNIPVGFGDCR
jgi:hypothetical protein